MKPGPLSFRPLVLVATLLLAPLGLVAPMREAAAQDASSLQREAARHFDHAVALYAEADYQGALVEFRRAYAIAPNPTVLYNVGETAYQLQDYAGALAAFSRYLSDAPPTAAHRGEVEASLEVLRERVGHLAVVTVPAGADVAVDDVPVGKTPLADRLVVSVGHRKVSVTLAGRPTVVRYVDVAADDNASLTVELPLAGAEHATPFDAAPSRPRAPARGPDALRTVGWVSTAMLAAGATAMGALALKSSNDLASARSTFPVAQATLQADADHTRTYSIVADSLTVGAIVVGAATLVATLLSSSPSPADKAATLRLSPSSCAFALPF
jgi:tetratricopeptide (TPR) repeat protein